MDKLRICFGSSDGEFVADTHMGDTDSFYVYDVFAKGERKFIEARRNSVKELDHAKTGKMKRIIEIVNDGDIFAARQKSPNFINIAKNTKYQPVVVKADKISDALSIIEKSYEELMELVLRRKNGEVFNIIPELK